MDMRLFLGALFAFASFAALADDAPKRLTAADLSVQTHKSDGKTIQARGQCFFADVSEYRCAIGVLGTVFVRLDLSEIEPGAMKKTIEDNCDTLDKMMGRGCAVDITFVYQGNDRNEKPDGSTVMLILAKDGQ